MNKYYIPVPAAYNPGECRISKLERGPRGGKVCKCLMRGIPATGGSVEMFLEPGFYKRTWWSNNWPHCDYFEVHDNDTWGWVSPEGIVI